MAICFACLKPIEDGATKCHECGSFQRPWRNWLPTLAAVFAILAFLGSAATFILATATDVFTRLIWKDEISVIAYSTGGPLVVLNSGSGELFVEHVALMSSEADYRGSRLIGEVVAKNSFAKFELEEGPVGSFVQDVTDEKWEALKTGEISGVMPYFFSTEHPYLATLKEYLGPRLRTFSSNCVVAFRSIVNLSVVEEEFPCVGVFFRLKTMPP